MKKYNTILRGIFCLLFAGSSVLLSAQTQTLMNDVDVNGAFGGPFVEFSEINGQTGVSVGGGGALVINDFFIGGYGMSGQFADFTLEQRRNNLDFGHGGFWLGYTLRPSSLIHLYSDVKTGWGTARVKEFRDDDDEFSIYADPFFTVLPQIGLEVNITSFMRLSFTGGYRFVFGVDDIPGLNDDLFSSPIGTITLRFGGFSDDDWDDDDDYDTDWD